MTTARPRPRDHAADELSEAVELALRDPSARQERGRSHTPQLFGRFTDGKNAERIAEPDLDAGARVVRDEHAPGAAPGVGAGTDGGGSGLDVVDQKRSG